MVDTDATFNPLTHIPPRVDSQGLNKLIKGKSTSNILTQPNKIPANWQG